MYPQAIPSKTLAAESFARTFGLVNNTCEVKRLAHFLQRLPTAHWTKHLGQTWPLQSTHFKAESRQEWVPLSFWKAGFSDIVPNSDMNSNSKVKD